ncbi:hypothetical protein DQP57_00575 [Mycobacterium colombiense]|uniref:Integrase n=1 Tax=Mycobacterium colombiense TaxID=339268 RepID=A0A329MD94_9MYCO|nr:site-specific integrase [Mycobacterium colombiense]RAV17552.1 hypothetical protein DQP57_00575 [Mycobacterium colombiense]
MASVHPHPSKRFPEGHKARYRFPDGSAGATTFPDKAQAELFVRMVGDYGAVEALRMIGQSMEPKRVASGPTVRECIERYIEQKPNKNTRKTYRGRAKTHINPTLGDVRINRLTPELIQSWVNERTCSSSTTHLAWALLFSSLEVAFRRGEIRTNPAQKATRTLSEGIRIPRTLAGRKPPVFLDRRDEYPLVLKSVPECHRTLVEFIAETGCRLGEALALTPADVNLKTGKVHFCKSFSKGQLGTTKTVRSDREVAVPQRVLDQLDLSGEYVFVNKRGNRIHADSFRSDVWVPAMAKSGLPKHRRPTIHDLRHSHASWLFDKGLPPHAIQERLGHSDVTTTLSIYGHSAADVEERILAALDDL